MTGLRMHTWIYEVCHGRYLVLSNLFPVFSYFILTCFSLASLEILLWQNRQVFWTIPIFFAVSRVISAVCHFPSFQVFLVLVLLTVWKHANFPLRRSQQQNNLPNISLNWSLRHCWIWGFSKDLSAFKVKVFS